MEPILYVPPKIKGFRLSVLSIAVSWILLSIAYLTNALCNGKPNFWVSDVATVAFLVAICTFQQKALVELAVFSISMLIFVVLTIVQTCLHYNWIVQQLHNKNIGVNATTPSTVFSKTDCSNYRWDGGVTMMYILQSISLALTAMIAPVAYYLNIKLFLHRWALRKVIVISPIPCIFGKYASTQTDPIEKEEMEEKLTKEDLIIQEKDTESLVASLCAYILLTSVSLVYLFGIYTEDSTIHVISLICIATCCVTWTMEGIPEMVTFLTNLLISSVIVTYLQVCHFIKLFDDFKLPSCPEGQIQKRGQCNDLRPNAPMIIYLVVFFFLLFVNVVLMPITFFLAAKWFVHKWKIRHVKFIAPTIQVIASTTGTQTEEFLNLDNISGKILKPRRRRRPCCWCCVCYVCHAKEYLK